MNIKSPMQTCALLITAAFLTILSACDYARMREDEALDTYGYRWPDMPAASVPTTGGLDELLIADPDALQNPIPASPQVIRYGQVRYNYFCRHCHGPQARGYGTVGQSFAPLPTSLVGPYVQSQSDGLIFYRTSLGFRRHPSLYHTVSANDRWAIIHYLRFLARG